MPLFSDLIQSIKEAAMGSPLVYQDQIRARLSNNQLAGGALFTPNDDRPTIRLGLNTLARGTPPARRVPQKAADPKAWMRSSLGMGIKHDE